METHICLILLFLTMIFFHWNITVPLLVRNLELLDFFSFWYKPFQIPFVTSGRKMPHGADASSQGCVSYIGSNTNVSAFIFHGCLSSHQSSPKQWEHLRWNFQTSLHDSPAANFDLSPLSFLFSFSFCFKEIGKRLSYLVVSRCNGNSIVCSEGSRRWRKTRVPFSAFAWLVLPGTRLRVTGTPPLQSWRAESSTEGKKDSSLIEDYCLGYQYVHQRSVQWPLTQSPWYLMTSRQSPTSTHSSWSPVSGSILVSFIVTVT